MAKELRIKNVSTGRTGEYVPEVYDSVVATPFLVEASATGAGTVELATSTETIAGTDATRAVTPAGLATLTASDTRAGLVELAINSECNTGTATDRAVTPANLPSAVKTHAGLGSSPMAATFVLGNETGGNTRNLAIQLNDAAGDPLTVRAAVKAYFSDDANGDSLITTMPSGGVSIGTDGLIIPGAQSLADGVYLHGNLAISGVDATMFKTTQAAVYVINGISHNKNASDSLEFTAAHVITASKFGIIRVQINAAGTISTKVPLATQAYNDAPTALAALPAVDAGNVSLGYIAIANNAGDWTAKTDDLTDGSDVTTAAFTDVTEIASGVPKVMDLVSEADGDIDINIVEASSKSAFYMVVILASGKLAVSGAITFA